MQNELDLDGMNGATVPLNNGESNNDSERASSYRGDEALVTDVKSNIYESCSFFGRWFHQDDPPLALDTFISLLDALSFFGVASLSEWSVSKRTSYSAFLFSELSASLIVFVSALSYRRLAVAILNKKHKFIGLPSEVSSGTNAIAEADLPPILSFQLLGACLRLFEGYKIYLVTAAAFDFPGFKQPVELILSVMIGVLALIGWKNMASQKIIALLKLKDTMDYSPFLLADNDGAGSFLLLSDELPPCMPDLSCQVWQVSLLRPSVVVDNHRPSFLFCLMTKLNSIAQPLSSLFIVIDHHNLTIRDVWRSISLASCMIGFSSAMGEFSELIVDVMTKKCLHHDIKPPGFLKSLTIEVPCFIFYALSNLLLHYLLKSKVLPRNEGFDAKKAVSILRLLTAPAVFLLLCESVITQTIPVLLALNTLFDVSSQDIPCHQWPENTSYIVVILVFMVNLLMSLSSSSEPLRYYAEHIAYDKPLGLLQGDQYVLYTPQLFYKHPCPSLTIHDKSYQRWFLSEDERPPADYQPPTPKHH